MQKVHRLLVLAAPSWNDYDYLKSEFLRLGSIHKKIEIIFPDDTSPWMLHIRDWCKNNPEKFAARGYPKDVFTYGSAKDEERDWRMFWEGDPHEVWQIEASRNCQGQADQRFSNIWPHLWDAAMAMNMQCVRHSNPGRRKPKIIRRKPRPTNPRWQGRNRWTGD